MKDLIKIHISHQLEKFGFIRKRFELKKILDKDYNVIEGTIPDRSDNDSAWLFALSSRCKNIYDIGANIGQSAMLMLYNDFIENIVLIDPNPKALSLAAENLIINSLSHKAKFINAFLSDKNGGIVDFFTIGGGGAGSKYQEFAKTASKLNSHFNVNTVTLDFIIRETGIFPQLVKIDVEGAEIDVLNGACVLASKAEAMFMVEIHSGEVLSITDNTKLILDWCNRNNYTGWYLKNKTQLDIESIKKRGRYHSLLMPKNKPFPEYLISINESDNLSGNVLK